MKKKRYYDMLPAFCADSGMKKFVLSQAEKKYQSYSHYMRTLINWDRERFKMALKTEDKKDG